MWLVIYLFKTFKLKHTKYTPKKHKKTMIKDRKCRTVGQYSVPTAKPGRSISKPRQTLYFFPRQFITDCNNILRSYDLPWD